MTSATERFLEMVKAHFEEKGHHVGWVKIEDSKQMVVQIKSESGYFVSAKFGIRGEHVIIYDEWGRSVAVKPTKANLEDVKSWAYS
ncbi:MAG: hypothetical protein BEU04_01700 [Marine Group III euryarchaeote CG-Bathy1]|uniref:Uncharacterized protein n=1 Tax=Marine Group III euryarchaeote CG-Bathy1 TaxID=1889001 RepID=A0A1J5T731_9ARCH|nr:MAG: hypothetical protein BEU04_01700 [Marine Group III euryarchaeote CG-Bathy1]